MFSKILKIPDFWGIIGRVFIFITYSTIIIYNATWLTWDIVFFIALKTLKGWLNLFDKIMCACNMGTRGLRRIARTDMYMAKTYDDWRKSAAELDELSGNTLWRSIAEGAEYDFEVVKKTKEQIKALKSEGDIEQLFFVLQMCLSRSFAGLNNKDLFSNSNLGTKHLVEDFTAEVQSALNYLASIRYSSDADSAMVTRSFYNLTQSYGRTALCLSGGGSLCMYHLGIVKCLIEQEVMPSVISGTSGGSIIAAMCAINTNEALVNNYIKPDISSRYGVSWFDPLLDQLYNFITTGYLSKSEKVASAARLYYGDVTFGEAYEKTGRVVNISVTTRTATGSHPLLLNYLSTPSVLLWSAVVASCALPGLIPSQKLMVKNNQGDIVPYSSGLVYADGSIHADLPMQRLAELFNVNHFIVAQVNPHVSPFIRAHSRPGRDKGRSFIRETEYLLNLDVQSRMRKLAKLGLFPRVYGNNIAPVFLQRYVGNVTICPTMSLFDNFRAIQQPTYLDMKRYILKGEQATWPRLPMIRHAMGIESALRECTKRWPYMLGPRASVALAHSKRIEDAIEKRNRNNYNSNNNNIINSNNNDISSMKSSGRKSPSRSPRSPSPTTIEEIEYENEEAFPSPKNGRKAVTKLDFDRRSPWAKQMHSEAVARPSSFLKKRSFSTNALSAMGRR